MKHGRLIAFAGAAMDSKIRVTSAAVLAVVAACAFIAAPGNPAAGALVHHTTAASPLTGFTQDRVCDNASTTLCMSGDDGVNGVVTGALSGTNNQLHMNEFVTTNCNNGKVSDGSGSQGPPCPFADGSGLNTKFDNDSIVELINFASGLTYAAFEEPGSHWGVIEENTGPGQLWVQVGDLSGLDPNAMLSAPSIPDSGFVTHSRCELLFQVLIVDLLRDPVLEPGVPTPRIVPEFDVPHNVAARVLTGRILGTVNALVLQRGEERLGHRIIVTYSGAADGMPEPVTPQRPGELGGRVIAAAVRVENRIPAEPVITGGHPDGLLDERRSYSCHPRPSRSPSSYDSR